MKTMFKGWAAIRKPVDASLFIDVQSISSDQVYTEQRARTLDKRIPSWSGDNPVEKIARITITED